MKRLLVMAATVAFLLGLGAPAVLAAEPVRDTGSVLVAINRAVDIPAGDHLDSLVVIGGDARISGDVTSIVVVRGTATLVGATTESLVVVNGSADLQAGTTVTGDVRTLDGVVTLLSQGSRALYGCDPLTGGELWRVEERQNYSGSTRPVTRSASAAISCISSQ